MKKTSLYAFFILLQIAGMCYRSGAQNIIASYPLNGNANDVSGNSLNGTIVGSPSFVTDRFGNANSAISFPGNTANRIEVDDNPLLHTPSITIAAWVREIGIDVIIKTIIDKPLGTGQSDSWHFGVITNGGYVYTSWFFNDPASSTGSQVTAPAYINDWHYVVATFDNTSKLHKLYVDGLLKTTGTFNSTIGYDNNKIYIGAALENNGLNFPMDGELDDIKIYDGALSAEQIASEYNAGITYDNRGSGGAVYFPGTSGQSYAQLPSLLDGTNIFTVDFWVKTTDNSSNPTFWLNPVLVGNVNPVSPDGDFGISLNNGQIGVWSGICSCGDQLLQTTKTISDDKWHHVAAVSDGTDMVLYVDGMLMPGSISTAGGTLQTVTRPWRIGMANSCCSNGSPVNAAIDEFRIWNAALTQAQIRDRMCKKTTNTDALYSNLLAYYHFNETMGTAIADSKNNNNGYLNTDTRISSGAPVGDAAAHDYINATKTASITHADGESFTVTSATGNPDGIQVYRVDGQPNTLNGTTSLGAMDKYFGVFQSGGTGPQYNAVYNYAGNPDVTASNESSLALYKRTDNAFTSWSNGVATLDMAAHTLSMAGQSTEYILGTSLILPLRLLSFSGARQDENVLLQWQTADESNTSHFEIERSDNGSAFKNMGNTPAINNSDVHHYQFTDHSPVKGINYYRLKQVDKDGRSSFSPIVKVIFDNSRTELKVYPNPATENITISYTGQQKKVTITIYDNAGRKVIVKELDSQRLWQADISGLAKGIYLIQVNDGLIQKQEKLIKL